MSDQRLMLLRVQLYGAGQILEGEDLKAFVALLKEVLSCFDTDRHLTTAIEAFTCPRCGAVSCNPNDKREGWCGSCKAQTGAPAARAVSYGFGWAISQLKAGRRVQRAGWNGRGMHLELQVPDEHSKMTLPYLFMKTVTSDLVPWLASQTDVLAEDWRTV